MKTMFWLIVLLGVACNLALAQTPAKEFPIIITDGADGSQELKFGLDPTATDGIDMHLTEAELPPVPPEGVFDARFIGTDIGISLGQGTIKDYRNGAADFKGMHTHELRYQVGTGTMIIIRWDWPGDVTGLLQDLFGGLVVNKVMRGKDSLIVTNLALNKLKMVITYMTTAVAQKSETAPDQYQLGANSPNPLRVSGFHASTTIHYVLPKAGEIKIEIFDLLGHHVRTLVKALQPAGRYTTNWDGRDERGRAVASGVFIYQLRADGFVTSRKMMLVH